MERTILDNEKAVRKAFEENVLFVGSFIVGPLMMTILTVLNMRFLKVKKSKMIAVLVIGFMLTLLYLYSFTFEKGILNTLFLLSFGAIIYKVYRFIAREEIFIFDTFISNTSVLTVSIYPYYYGAWILHIMIKSIMRGVIG